MHGLVCTYHICMVNLLQDDLSEAVEFVSQSLGEWLISEYLSGTVTVNSDL